MAENTGKLAGKTIFITGASRGIGKAIALKAAKDGANIVIAAKTAQPHPKLSGTIYTAAKEVEAAGGRCLPCIVDVRSEEAVRKAVEAAVQKFGGIDVLVNNASAISLQGTEELPMKKYDLMNQINSRGTYLCSHVCAPYLKKSRNPHILNISPPLNMNPKWFQLHVAYTMAKYGMSMCVLGMAEEFKEEGIAVNALWPKFIIQTAATDMLNTGNNSIASRCRTPNIMSDAAYVMLTQDSRSLSGHFALDEDILRRFGVTDFEQYAVAPGNELALDLFLDDEDSNTNEHQSSRPAAIFQSIKSVLNETLVKNIGGVFEFNLTGTDQGKWYLDLKNGTGSYGQGSAPNGADCEMTIDSNDFVKMLKGELRASSAFMSGNLKIKGDVGFAMKLEKLMTQLKSKL